MKEMKLISLTPPPSNRSSRGDRSACRLAFTEQVCCVQSGVFSNFFFFQAEDGIRDVAVTGVQTCALPISDQIVGHATAVARNALLSVVNFVLMLVALFFFFRDGEAMAGRVRDLLPMEREHKEAIAGRLYATLSAVVQSMLVTAVTQGLLAGLGYRVCGLSFSVFLGFITGLASFLPLAGPAFVWSGVALFLALTGHVGHAVGLAVWGVLAVSTADNWIKPLFIGGRAKLPTFPLLISILGGLSVYGFLGVFLGPVVLAILFVFVEIYREEYQRTPAAAPPPEAPERRAASG